MFLRWKKKRFQGEANCQLSTVILFWSTRERESSQARIGRSLWRRKANRPIVLNDIYPNSDRECDVEISFDHASDGSQQNDCRDLPIT